MSGLFTRILTHDTPLRLGPQPVDGASIALFRAAFAGLILTIFLRPRDISINRLMIPMVVAFATMNALFILALSWGKTSNVILLQYTAPLWMYLGSIWFLGESPSPRGAATLVVGLLGIGVITWGEWNATENRVILAALGSGVAYAAVILFLRALNQHSSSWLTSLNLLGSALLLSPFFIITGWPELTFSQYATIALLGTVQMAIPYWLASYAARTISPQEIGLIALLEPVLSPIWAYLVAPEKESPSVYTILGGILILAAVAWRYRPGLSRRGP